jgi:hypothetical protein
MLKSGVSQSAANNHQLAPVCAYNTAVSAAAANPSSRKMFRTGTDTAPFGIHSSEFAVKDSLAIPEGMGQPFARMENNVRTYRFYRRKVSKKT